VSKTIILSLIAMVAHEVNRAYCQAMGDNSQLAWGDAPQWQKDSAEAGVAMHLANPNATPADSHASWLAQKEADGWTYGEVKDAEKKQHPCFMPYDALPAEQKAKDYIFRGVVHAVAGIADVVGEAPAPIALSVADIGVPAGSKVVRYIGSRESWSDRLYGSGLAFHKGQARAVPSLIAANFLRHSDVFEEISDVLELTQSVVVDDTAALMDEADLKAKAVLEEQNALQELRDSIQNMGKESLEQFAKSHYRQDINKRHTLVQLREQVIGLVDQYGAV
jgi:hypothetical protein